MLGRPVEGGCYDSAEDDSRDDTGGDEYGDDGYNDDDADGYRRTAHDCCYYSAEDDPITSRCLNLSRNPHDIPLYTVDCLTTRRLKTTC